MADYLQDRYPALARKLPRLKLATLPTPVRTHDVRIGTVRRPLAVKHDNLTGELYGGNKVRKLEYIFPRADNRHRLRIATFGAVGSNHALATALYARQAGFECTCFLSHQVQTPLIVPTLNAHLKNRTELIRFGGDYQSRLSTLRNTLWGRHAWIIPMGGSSWLGTIGFVAAGLELATQISNGEIAKPDRIYVGTGTMGTAVGLALGLALADLQTEINAVRVSDASITNPNAINALTRKTASMMRGLDDSIPEDIADKTHIRLRNSFFGTGYAHTTPETDTALEFGQSELGLKLEPTYTGKTITALLTDMQKPKSESLNFLYWHTYNSAQIESTGDRVSADNALPQEFERYFENSPEAALS